MRTPTDSCDRAIRAIHQGRDSLEKNAIFWMAHKDLGRLVQDRGETPEAMAHYSSGVELEQTGGSDSARAVALAERTCRLTGNRVAQHLDMCSAEIDARLRSNRTGRAPARNPSR